MSSPAPLYVHELPQDLEWINSEPIALASLRGRVTLLSFWTGSSVYCQHQHADLRTLESKFSDGLAVLGVHTPKHQYEAESANVLKCINRWFVRHPVINDRQWRLWRLFGVPAWPTCVLLDAEGKVSGIFVGERQLPVLEKRIAELLEDAQTRGLRSHEPAPFGAKPELRGALQFPSKLAATATRLYIADTGHNRVLECSFEGQVTRVFGSGNAGFWDGKANEAGMREPTGLAIGKEQLFICDTGNNAIRRIRLLANDQLDTIAGTGRYGHSAPEAGASRALDLASPADCAYFQDKLYVSFSGNHQVWAFDLLRNTAARISGSGQDGIADGALTAASYSQPQGISLGRDALYVMDTGNAALRCIKLADATVTTLIGEGPFESGDSDGSASFARLQQPQGLVYDAQRNVVWIADSYNNKIKVYSPAKSEVKSLNLNYKLHEPNGLAIADGAVWIANQNAHELLRLDLKTGKLTRVVVAEGI